MKMLTLGSVMLAQAAAADCSDDRVTVAGTWGQAHFRVDVADDPEERSQGLMFVESLPMLGGMLFVYDTPQTATFWMKNTLIPLDMLFADDRGVIKVIHANAVPQDLTTINGGEGISAVLEINGGLAARLGISEGDTLMHPSFGEDAAATCAK